MYAIVKTGGKQYRVEPGMLVDIEKLDALVGQQVELSDVLLVQDGSQVRIGQPLVEKAKINCQVVEHKQGPKLIIFKKIRRQGKRLKKGHRQQLTRVRVDSIVLS